MSLRPPCRPRHSDLSGPNEIIAEAKPRALIVVAIPILAASAFEERSRAAAISLRNVLPAAPPPPQGVAR